MDGNNQLDYGVINLHIVSLVVNKSAIALVPITVAPGEAPVIAQKPTVVNSTDERSSAILLGIIDLAESISKSSPSSHVVVFVHSSVSRRKIVAAGTDFGAIRFAVQSEFGNNEAVFAVAAEEDRRLNPESYQGVDIPTTGVLQTITNAHSVQHAVESLTPVIVATDGSVNRSYAGGSWGWVADNGEFGYGTLKAASGSLVCELSGVEGMLGTIKTISPLVVLVDSKIALRLIENPDSMKDSHAVGTSCRTIARRIKKKVDSEASRGRPVVFRWVKAHNGNVLNEGADRLARNARLASSFSTTAETTDGIARAIAEETVASHKSSPR
jgi:ribonuclease HI